MFTLNCIDIRFINSLHSYGSPNSLDSTGAVLHACANKVYRAASGGKRACNFHVDSVDRKMSKNSTIMFNKLRAYGFALS